MCSSSTAIALVAVVMGMSVVAPMIPQAVAGHGGPGLSDRACEALESIPDPPSAVVELIEDHCNGSTGCPPSCNGVNVESIIF